ncbi:hypothetical protein MTO96_045730 [Rhipicephalus appendiculatus]
MRTSELYRSTESWTNTDLEMEFYMCNVVATPDELLHIRIENKGARKGCGVLEKHAYHSHICKQPATHGTKIETGSCCCGRKGF